MKLVSVTSSVMVSESSRAVGIYIQEVRVFTIILYGIGIRGRDVVRSELSKWI